MGKDAHGRCVKTNLDALVTALYVHLDDHVLPTRRRGRGRPSRLTDAELVCVAVAQVLLGCDAERHWLRVAPTRIGRLFPHLPCQAQDNRHPRRLGPVWVAVACWLARATPTWHERLRLMDGTPVRCGASRATVNRSGLGEIAGIWTLKNQLGLERHQARTTEGLWARISQRIVALNAAIWHNWLTDQPIKRSLTAYDH
ncbi:hypothetical protein ACSNOI_06175 [Actinomadura kijaniata]|uniref:hypothetical protein n=1 Tax=Actinomadura kijaniata TaxID=46161 RepID=UPI003F1C36BF